MKPSPDSDQIIHSNSVHYEPNGKYDLFTHEIKCAASHIDLSDVSMVQSMKDYLVLSVYTQLAIFGLPEGISLFTHQGHQRSLEVISGHSNEFRLGEKIKLGLDFIKLDAALDYRIDKCWAKGENNTGEIGLIPNHSDSFFRNLHSWRRNKY